MFSATEEVVSESHSLNGRNGERELGCMQNGLLSVVS
jgi:hypothetical protein